MQYIDKTTTDDHNQFIDLEFTLFCSNAFNQKLLIANLNVSDAV